MEGRDKNEPKRGPLATWCHEAAFIAGNAAPVWAFNISQFANNILSQAFIGRLGPQDLAAASLAISFINVACQTINFGLATGQETIVSQANGAGRYRDVGICLQRGLIVWVVSQAIMSVAALFGTEILMSLGQDPEISKMAGKYILYSLPTIWGMGLATVVCTWLQAQGIFTVVVLLGTPGLALQVAGLVVMLPRVGYLGATYATAASSWASAILFISYATWLERSRAPERRTLHGLTWEAFRGIGSYVKVALPSFAMVLFEWSALEVALVFAGVLPGAASGVPTSVSAMIMGVISICYSWSLALSQSASSRVGNTLGEGDGKLARYRATCAWTVQLVFAAACQVLLFARRRDWAVLFSSPDETEVLDTAFRLYPVLAIILFFDANAALISGLVRGAGVQHIGGILNLSAFYVVGIPLSALLCFHFDLGLEGIWLGIAGAFAAQAIGLGSLVAFSDFTAIAEGIQEQEADMLAAAQLLGDGITTVEEGVPWTGSSLEAPLLEAAEHRGWEIAPRTRRLSHGGSHSSLSSSLAHSFSLTQRPLF